MPLWVSAVLFLSQPVMFILGALTYHGIRMLAAKPLYVNPKGGKVDEAKLQAIANQAIGRQMSGVFDHLGIRPDMPVRQVIPDGDGRPKGETFAPVVGK